MSTRRIPTNILSEPEADNAAGKDSIDRRFDCVPAADGDAEYCRRRRCRDTAESALYFPKKGTFFCVISARRSASLIENSIMEGR